MSAKDVTLADFDDDETEKKLKQENVKEASEKVATEAEPLTAVTAEPLMAVKAEAPPIGCAHVRDHCSEQRPRMQEGRWRRSNRPYL